MGYSTNGFSSASVWVWTYCTTIKYHWFLCHRCCYCFGCIHNTNSNSSRPLGDCDMMVMMELECVFVDQFGCVGGKSRQFIHILNKIWFCFDLNCILPDFIRVLSMKWHSVRDESMRMVRWTLFLFLCCWKRFRLLVGRLNCFLL